MKIRMRLACAALLLPVGADRGVGGWVGVVGGWVGGWVGGCVGGTPR